MKRQGRHQPLKSPGNHLAGMAGACNNRAGATTKALCTSVIRSNDQQLPNIWRTVPQYLEDRVLIVYPDSYPRCSQAAPETQAQLPASGWGWKADSCYCGEGWNWPKLTSIYHPVFPWKLQAFHRLESPNIVTSVGKQVSGAFYSAIFPLEHCLS